MSIRKENTLSRIYEEKQKEEMGIDIIEDIVKGLLKHLNVDYSEYKIVETARYNRRRFFKKIGYKYRADFYTTSRIVTHNFDFARVFVDIDLERKVTRINLLLLDEEYDKVGKILEVTEEKEIKQIQMEGKLTI